MWPGALSDMILTTPSKYEGKVLLDIRIRTFLDRESSCTCYFKSTFHYMYLTADLIAC